MQWLGIEIHNHFIATSCSGLGASSLIKIIDEVEVCSLVLMQFRNLINVYLMVD